MAVAVLAEHFHSLGVDFEGVRRQAEGGAGGEGAGDHEAGLAVHPT